MKRSEWSQPTSNDAAYRRAGGRARYNLKRFDVAFKRRQSLLFAQDHSAPALAIWRIWRGNRRVESRYAEMLRSFTGVRFRPSRSDVCRYCGNEAGWVLMLTNVDILLFFNGFVAYL